MTQLFIEPLDVWLFRDGRPFAAGSDHRAESLFPPFPTTTLGAIRRRELVKQGVNLWERDPDVIQSKVGEPVRLDAPTDLRGLTLRGPFVTRHEDGKYVRYHPQPADAHLVDGKLQPVSRPAKFQAGVQAGMPSSGLVPLGLGDDYEKEDEPLWLAESELEKYLKGDEPANGTKASDLFMTEDRIGIGMNNDTYTVSSGALYEVQFIRPRKDVGLSLIMAGYDWSTIQKDWLQLGGESRAAMYKTIEQVEPWPTQVGQALPQQFKAYLATPAYFADGWLPKNGDWKDFFGEGVTLVSAAIGRYASIGGFDLASDPNHSGAHRASRRFVPAGSVYYFKSNGAKLLKDSLTDFGSEFGLGQILIEEW
jgi:CRISPR-associated protein Cmr3